MERKVGVVGFAAQRMEMLRNGWLQARYYSADDSVCVRDFLSFDDVFDVNPFEVGVSHRKERRAFAARLVDVRALLDLDGLMDRAFVSLSNGETRRVMLARELLKGPDELILEDPFNGLDPDRCRRLQAVIAELETRGLVVTVTGDRPVDSATGRWARATRRQKKEAAAAVEFRDVTIKIGRRCLLKGFSWRIGEGERWILRGRNGSGKTTLMALITGDSPLAYGLDVSVFGKRRDIGCDLHAMRRKIAMVSPEMQAYLEKDADELLDEALSRNPKLLILDEPCMNLSLAASRRLCRKAAAWLKAHPKATAICIAHRPEHVPAGFDREMNLDER